METIDCYCMQCSEYDPGSHHPENPRWKGTHTQTGQSETGQHRSPLSNQFIDDLQTAYLCVRQGMRYFRVILWKNYTLTYVLGWWVYFLYFYVHVRNHGCPGKVASVWLHKHPMFTGCGLLSYSLVIVNRSNKKTITNIVLVHLLNLTSLPFSHKYPIYIFQTETSWISWNSPSKRMMINLTLEAS